MANVENDNKSLSRKQNAERNKNDFLFFEKKKDIFLGLSGLLFRGSVCPPRYIYPWRTKEI